MYPVNNVHWLCFGATTSNEQYGCEKQIRRRTTLDQGVKSENCSNRQEEYASNTDGCPKVSTEEWSEKLQSEWMGQRCQSLDACAVTQLNELVRDSGTSRLGRRR